MIAGLYIVINFLQVLLELEHYKLKSSITFTKPSPPQLYIQITTYTLTFTACFGCSQPFSSETFI
jgi:hypothetical protein